MGSAAEVDVDKLKGVEKTVYVAVGENVDEGKILLLWAIQNFSERKICVLHVHQPQHVTSSTNEKLGDYLKYLAASASQDEQQTKNGLLEEYLSILAEAKVQANKISIEMDSVEKGIVQIIAQYDIRWLIMGTASVDYNSCQLEDLKSSKANFVCQQAPSSCNICFVNEGKLLSLRRGGNEKLDAESPTPLLLLNSDSGTEHSATPISDSFHDDLKLLDTTYQRDVDAGEDETKIYGMPRRFRSWFSMDPRLLFRKVVGLHKDIVDASEDIYDNRLQQAIEDIKKIRQIEFKEVANRWKLEDDIVEAKCKAKALEDLTSKEIMKRKELEQILATEKQEVVKTNNEKDGYMRELEIVRTQNSELERNISESQSTVAELEEKIISAVELLISFRDKRDKLKIEHDNAVRRVKDLKKLVKEDVKACYRAEFPTFSFMEINNATNDFDPSWKIAEGKYGSAYKGIIQYMHVAIRMLPSYGSQNQMDFSRKVECLSRVRHPNILTLIGFCPESRSLVYEYLRNGSLEDHLSCKDKTPPLSWQIRIRIAADICSALIFLHANEPCIVHGNLKPSKVLLDSNFVGKIGDLGINYLVRQNEDLANFSIRNTNLDKTNAYMDPEYVATGMLTPESDIYSFGMLLLRILTGRPVTGVVKDVTCALGKENLEAVLDSSAGEWPLDQAKQLAHLALKCCEKTWFNRPDLVSEIWDVLEPLRASCMGSTPFAGPKKLSRVPSHFVCPIFQEVMKDPQIAADGFTYEADAIRGWLYSGHDTSPMTNLKLENTDLLPNYALHDAIQEWQLLT